MQEGSTEWPGRRRQPAEGAWARRLRDYLVAPLTEEFVFRGCMAPLLLLGVRVLDTQQPGCDDWNLIPDCGCRLAATRKRRHEY
jgi:Type II CAAX prenyl endopeptidase Rce1-like